MKKKEQEQQEFKLKSLTWKYFWRNKGLELIGVLLLIGLVMLLPTIGKLFGCWETGGEPAWWVDGHIQDGVCDNSDYRSQGAIILLSLTVILVIIFLFIKLNWSFADTEARNKLDMWEYD